MRKIVFICTGNTCRSPMAEGLFRQFLEKQGIFGVLITSAGLGAFSGDCVSEYAVHTCAHFGVDISLHRARNLNPYDFEPNTFYVCMTSAHKEILRKFTQESKIFVLDVADPYGGNADVYMQCASQIIARFSDIVSYFCLDVQITRMANQDVSSIAAIEEACFSTPWSRAGIEAELQNEQARFFTASVQNTVIGYIGAHNILGEVYISNIAVLPEFRRKGIASELLTKLIYQSEDESADFLTLEVRKSNTNAIEMYRQFGFVQAGERKNFYTLPAENALIMTKHLKKLEWE